MFEYHLIIPILYARVFENSVSVIISTTSKGVNKSSAHYFTDGESEAQRSKHHGSSPRAACAHLRLEMRPLHDTSGFSLSIPQLV